MLGVEVLDHQHGRRQIGQLVQHDVRFEVTNRLDKCLPVEDITKNRFGTEVAQ